MTSRFLFARFASMLVGFALLAASFLAFTVLAGHIENDFIRSLAGVTSLAVGLWLAYAVNATVGARVDPDGAQRAAVQAQRESAPKR